MAGKFLQLVTERAKTCHSRDVGATYADKLDPLNWPKTLLTDHQNVLRKLQDQSLKCLLI